MRRLSGTKFAERKVLSQYYILWQKGEPSRAKFLRGLEKAREARRAMKDLICSATKDRVRDNVDFTFQRIGGEKKLQC